MKKTNRIALALAGIIISLALGACSGEAKASPKVSTPAVGVNPAEIEAKLEGLLLESNNPQGVIDAFEQNKDNLQNQVGARVYYATALCQMAGAAKETVDQLRWVRKGLGEFDSLTNDFPNEAKVYLYQAITYSNFPTVLGVNGLVVDDINKVNQGLKTKGWKLGEGELRQLSLAWINLAKTYKKPEYLASAKTQIAQDGLAGDQGIQDQLKAAAKEVQ